MVAVRQDYRLSISNAPRLYNEHGQRIEERAPIYQPNLDAAKQELELEFHISSDKIPALESISSLFSTISNSGNLSHESQVALLYRLVVIGYLSMLESMRESGENITAQDVDWLTRIVDSSIDWSEAADDHVKLEALASDVNADVESLFESFGIRRG